MYKLSKRAQELLEEEYDILDEEFVKNLADKALDRPSDAGFWDDDLYETHTLAFHTPDWSLTDEYIIDQANYRAALEALSSEFPEDAEAATVGHWTYSTFQCIKVRVLTKKGKIAPVFVRFASLVRALELYPVLDDELWSELESEVWYSALEDAVDWAKKDEDNEDLSEEQWDRVSEYIDAHYHGYAEPNWVSEDWVDEAVEKIRTGDIQLHQDTTLY